MSGTDPGVKAGQERARSPGGVLLVLVERFHMTALFACAILSLPACSSTWPIPSVIVFGLRV